MTSETKNPNTKNTDQETLTKAQRLAEAVKAKAASKNDVIKKAPETSSRISSRTEAEMKRGREILEFKERSKPKKDHGKDSGPVTIITDN